MARVRLKKEAEPIKSKKEEVIEAYKGGKEKTPTGKTNEFVGDIKEYLSVAKQRGLDVDNIKSSSELQSKVYDKLMSSEEGRGILKNMWKEYGVTKKGGGGASPEPMSESQLSSLKSAFVDSKLGGRTKQIISSIPEKKSPSPAPVVEKKVNKPERRTVSEIIETVKGKSKSGTEHGVGIVYKNKEMEFDPKTARYVPVEGSEYTDVVMFPQDSEYMQGEGKQVSEKIGDVAERYRAKYNAKNIVAGKASGEGYGQEYLNQMRRQKIIK